jgi:hypothetical protein
MSTSTEAPTSCERFGVLRRAVAAFVSIDAQDLVERAVAEVGLEDFGGDEYREGLDRLCDALTAEADLTELGVMVTTHRLSQLLSTRLQIEQTYRDHPEIDEQQIIAPIFILGLPRTGTTATSQLLAMDPQIRSLRLWESGNPVPPPEQATQHNDPRIAATGAGLEAMYATWPRMTTLYFQTATGPTECQDLLGRTFRTSHFDGLAHVPSYVDWVMDCDMLAAYVYHRRTLKLLQWHCPPHTWHLKTPVHMLSMTALDSVYPDARFIWTHRDPAEVLGSVCDLIAYTRSWVSARDDSAELGAQQLRIWTTALRRAIDFRDRAGEDRFADIRFEEIGTDPVAAFERAYAGIGLPMTPEARTAIARWASDNPRSARGAHEYDISKYHLDPSAVRGEFEFYTDRFHVLTG